mmetsp:Transcript_13060/g.20175  ORF Transcript_13060/g.20175 Transcript_13060/m.20175 type:complete len:260 (-) Transcript_13060:158-937(-)
MQDSRYLPSLATYYSDDSYIQLHVMHSTITSATTTMLVSPNKAPSEPAAGSSRDSSSSLPSKAFAAEHRHRCTVSTPPPFEDSFIMKKTTSSFNPPSGGKLLRRPMMSPPPLPKRCKHYVDPSGCDACSDDSSSSRSCAPEQPQTPASAKSVLIDLNAGHSILNNPKSVDVPPLKLFLPTQEPRKDGNSVGRFPTRNCPILSLDAPDDDDIDAELASYQPRFRLQMKPLRQRRRFVPKHVMFIPIQNDSSAEASEEQDS